MKSLERYRPLIDDWSAFTHSVARPLPTCVISNPLRASPAVVAAWLRREDLDPQPLPWMPGAFLLPPDAQPGKTLAHQLGLFWIQEAVATVPVAMLGPQPGERVLDLCAAPGNKTAQLAVRMNNQGTLVAVDRSANRLGVVRRQTERLGLVNTCLLHADGCGLPADIEPFDRVLVDVPCSCEGTSRKQPSVLARAASRGTGWRTHVQLALLRKAVQLCKVGGRIAYATCTYAPEENELVLAGLLRTWPAGTVALRSASLPGLRTVAGISHWQGQDLPCEIAGAHRIYPHLNDTGGFFVALLEKCKPLPRQGTQAREASLEPTQGATTMGRPSDTASGLPASEREAYRSLLARAYGLSAVDLRPFRWTEGRRETAALESVDLAPPVAPAPLARGLSTLHVASALPRLVTVAALLLGHLARHNVIELSADQIDPFFTRAPQPIRPEQVIGATGSVPLIARSEGIVLGLAELTEARGQQGVRSVLPKRWYRDPL